MVREVFLATGAFVSTDWAPVYILNNDAGNSCSPDRQTDRHNLEACPSSSNNDNRNLPTNETHIRHGQIWQI